MICLSVSDWMVARILSRRWRSAASCCLYSATFASPFLYSSSRTSKTRDERLAACCLSSLYSYSLAQGATAAATAAAGAAVATAEAADADATAEGGGRCAR